MTWTLWIPGMPLPWQRPRTGVARNGRRVFFHADRDQAWRAHVRAAWLNHHGDLRLDGPLAAGYIFVGPPKAADWDNLVKSVNDALQGARHDDGFAPAFLDDRQLRRCLGVEIVPATRVRPAGVYVHIEPLEETHPWIRSIPSMTPRPPRSTTPAPRRR